MRLQILHPNSNCNIPKAFSSFFKNKFKSSIRIFEARQDQTAKEGLKLFSASKIDFQQLSALTVH